MPDDDLRQSSSLYDKLCSIVHDFQFVQSVVDLHRQTTSKNEIDEGLGQHSWPVIANQRCGSVSELKRNI